MADERTVIFKLQLDSKALTESAKQAEDQLKKLQPELKKVAEESGKNSAEYQKLKTEVDRYTKQLKDSSSALAINEELAGKERLTTNEQARAKKALSVALNMLTEDERNNTEEGRRMVAQLKATNESLQAQGKAVSDGRSSVGMYEEAIKAAVASLGTLQKQSSQIGYAIGQNTKKVDDGTKALAEMRAKGIEPTDSAYQQLAQEVEFYTKAVEQNKRTLAEVESEMQSQTETLKETEKQAAQIGFVYGQQEEQTKSLKTQLKELKAELATMDPNSEAFIEGSKRAGELADKIKDVNEAVGAQASGSVFEQLSNQAGLLGQDLVNLDFEGVAEKARGFQAIASKVSLKEMIGGVKNAGSALVSLGTTILASPIFWLVGAGAAIYAFWDDISKVLFKVSDAQLVANASAQAYRDTLGDFEKGAGEAAKKTMEVESAFKLAKKGVISKDEALKKYNDTLGDSFGKATDLNEAEALYNAKTKDYIKNAGLRAQANALFAKAAEERVKTLTQASEFELSYEQAQALGMVKLTKGQAAANKYLTALQAEATKKQQEQAEKVANAIEKQAQSLMESAEAGDRALGIQTESEKAFAEEQTRLAKERADAAKAAAQARVEAEREALDRIRELTISNGQMSADLEKRQLDARFNFLKRIAEAEISDKENLAKRLLELEESRAKDERELFAGQLVDRIDEIKKAAAEEIAQLKGSSDQIAEQTKLINEKANNEINAARADFGDKEVELEQRIENAKQAVKDAGKAADEQRNADRFTALEAELLREETRLREQGKTEEEIARATAQHRIDIAKALNDAVQNDTAKSDADKLKAQAEYEAKLLEIKKQGIDADVEANRAAEEQKKQLRNEALDAAAQLIADFYEIEQQQLTAQLNAVNVNNLAQQEALANRLDAGLISQEKFNAESKKLEIQKAREEARIKKEQFEKQKQADLIAAGISIARAVINGYASQPFLPVGITMGTLAATLGAVQLAKIASAETPAFAEGGRTLPVLSGTRIGSGDGLPIFRSNGDNLLATVKTNEVILNEEHQRRAGGAEFFRRIGVPGFAAGGSTGARISSTVESNVLNNNALLQAIASMPAPVVDVKDVIGETSRRVELVDGANVF